MVQELKNYNYEFWHEEDGMELLQLALVVVVVVGLFAVVLGLQSVIGDNIAKTHLIRIQGQDSCRLAISPQINK